ncbi:MAG TPA: hypothetical protein VL306_00995 [Methylomirabilota bacterium]|jgi:hypothetical protein|nr:hypothetical protein [Methylomirabilota bacterium]
MEQNKILPDGLAAPDDHNQTKWIKAMGLSLLSIIGFALTWQFFAVGLTSHHTLIFWLYPVLSAAVGVSFLALVSVVDVNKYLFWGVNLAILVIYLWLLPKENAVYLGGLFFFGLAFLFERHIRSDEHARANFSIRRIVSGSINLMVYALLIVLGFNIYAGLKTSFEKNPDAVYEQIGHYAASGLNYVPDTVGDFNPNQRFDDFVAKQAEAQDPSIKQAPPSIQEQVIAEFKKQLEQKFNLKVSGNPLLGEVVAGAVAEKIKDGSQSYHNFFPVIFAVFIVILLRSITFLFVWLTEIVCWAIYRILLATGFFRIEKVQVEVDKLQI